jgi:rare lipoprotein A
MTAKLKPGVARIAALAALVALGSPALAEAPVALAGPLPALATAVGATALIEAAPFSGSPVAQPIVAQPAYHTVAAGMASYYGRELAGNRTASGERFNPADLTAAHRTLPLGSRVRVTNPRTGDSVIVRINDRGPFHGNRLIDLSEAAARQIGIRAAGSGMVELAVADDATPAADDE